jgi:hypothetical protein
VKCRLGVKKAPFCAELGSRKMGLESRGLVVKHNYWTWNEKNTAGNAIDFFTQVEGKNFHQAMEIIYPALFTKSDRGRHKDTGVKVY